jgi:hypothetical protein
VLPAILTFVGPFAFFYGLVVSVGVLRLAPYGTPVWYLLIAEAIGQVGLFVLAAYTAKQFFRLKRSAPGLFVNLSLLGCIYLLIANVAGAVFIPVFPFDPWIITTIAFSMIWVVYMQVSRRVRHTFVN